MQGGEQRSINITSWGKLDTRIRMYAVKNFNIQQRSKLKNIENNVHDLKTNKKGTSEFEE